MSATRDNIFLFSVDLEDARDHVANGSSYKERVPATTLLYLEWLKKNNFSCTFFTVGTTAEKYPDLIKEIIKEGHEIACHSYDHTPIDVLGKDGFKSDLEKNISALIKAGASAVQGFRAPVFSLTEKSSEWAYESLASSGIKYSSSVLPAKNPLFGWENFGEHPKKMNEGVIEIPITLSRFGPLQVPIAGGVYFRVLPTFFIRHSIRHNFKRGRPVLSYFHPYDCDTEQEHYMHAGINSSRFYNFLMYYNRKDMFNRLDQLLSLNLNVITYRQYVKDYIR